MIKLNKPLLKTDKKLKAFTWKRVVLDREGGTNNVAKADLKIADPNWKGKTVIWKDIVENDVFTLEMVEELYSAKVATVKKVEAVVDNKDKKKTYFDG